jgi:hypothetical protein
VLLKGWSKLKAMIAEWTLMGAVQWGLGAGIGALALYKLVTLAFGDADLKTLSLKSVPVNAFEGRVVWITGASQGLGELLARSMFAKGALLILSARREDQLQRVANKLGDPSRVKVLPLDLTAGEDALSAAVVQVIHAIPTVVQSRDCDEQVAVKCRNHPTAFARETIVFLHAVTFCIVPLFFVYYYFLKAVVFYILLFLSATVRTIIRVEKFRKKRIDTSYARGGAAQLPSTFGL